MAHEATAATGPVSPCQNHPPSPQLPNMARELLKMLVMSVAKDPRVSLSPAANGPNDTRAESTLCPVPNEAPSLAKMAFELRRMPLMRAAGASLFPRVPLSRQ